MRLNTSADKLRTESPIKGNTKLSRMLRKTGLGVLSTLIASSAVTAQTVENQKKPPAPDAGRVVPLKEIARITDEPDKFLFVQPFAVFAGEDGSVYVQEFNEFLKFDAAGRFVGNLLKRGDGPGELSANLTDVIVRKDDILLYSSNNLRLIRIDLNGKLLQDKRFGENTFGELLGLRGGRYFFLKREPGQLTGVNGIYESSHRMVILPTQGDIIKTPEVLRMTEGRSYSRGRGMFVGISRLTATWVGDRDVFLFHSPDYLIRHLDLETGRIVGSFRRPYDRVKYEVKPARGYPVELVPKYYNDLCALLWRDDKLWAVTSTFDPKKGILVDVFSRDGKYLDNFFLPLFSVKRNNPQYYAPMAIHGNLLYVLEPDENDVISLAKYQIGGK
jgi:hypothetical protein